MMKTYERLSGTGIACGMILLFSLSILPPVTPQSYAVSAFGSGMEGKRPPAPFASEGMWFYGPDGTKTIPDISLEWIAVVFRRDAPSAETTPEGPQAQAPHQRKAQELLARYDGMKDFFCDDNLAENTCFFRVQKGFHRERLLDMIRILNLEEVVDYAHPTIDLNGKTYAYFNAIQVAWKTGVDQVQKDTLLRQAHAAFDEKEKVCRVDLSQIPFFEALHLLAEDIRIREAAPYLVEIRPSVQASFTLQIHGANIGDKIPFRFTVDFTDKIRIDPSSIANIYIRPENIQKELFELQVDPYDYVKAVSAPPITITGWMRFYAPGDFTLPPLRVKYTCATCSHMQERSLETDRVTVRVASLVPSGKADHTLLIPPDPVSPEYQEQSYHTKAQRTLLGSFVCYVLALLCIGWYALEAYKAKKRAQKGIQRKRDELLAERIRGLLGASQTGPDSVYVEETGTLFRQYLVEKYGVPTDPFGGTGEVYFESIKKRLPEHLADTIHFLLKEIDTVLALELDPYPGLERFKDDMMKVVE